MPEPVIVGVHEGALDQEGRPCHEIAAAAAAGALADAGMTLADVDGVLAAYAWEDPSIMFASQVADHLGLTPSFVDTCSFGGAGPAMMVAHAARAIRLGLCETAVLTAASNRASGLGRASAVAGLRDVLDPEFDVPYGAFVPTAYAMVASRYLAETGTVTEELAAISVIERYHASAHPLAKMRTPITVGDVVGSPVIASPLHLLECCLVTDFAGALVMTTGNRAADLDGTPVGVWGEAEAHDRLSLVAGGDSTRRGAARSGPRALGQAGIVLDDVDLLELYDSFTITVALTLEDLGICGRGEAGALAGSGELAADGRWPLNTNGGMLSYRTGGVSHVIEAVHQLRGTAIGLRVESPLVALVHGIGGVLSTHCTLVLGTGDRP